MLLKCRRECREKAQALIKNASAQLKDAKDSLQNAHAVEVNAEQALSSAGKAAAAGGAGMLSLQPQAMGTPSAAASATPAAAAVEGQADVKPLVANGAAAGLEDAPQQAQPKRRRTVDLLSHLDSIPRDVKAPPHRQQPAL